MITTQFYMMYIGAGAWGVSILLTDLKLMRNNKVRMSCMGLGLMMSGTQIILAIHEHTFTRVTNSDALHMPLFYLTVYNCLRYAYIKVYGVEPTYNKASWYDPKDGRKQNWFDVVVFFIPLLLSLGFVPFLAILKK
jgi:hypothetical protein